MQSTTRFLVMCTIFLISPLVLLLLLFLGFNIPLFLLYLIIVIEGVGLVFWGLSNVRTAGSQATSIRSTDETGSSKYYLSDRNRAEILAIYVKSAARKSSDYFPEYSRAEIAKVMRHILENSSTELTQIVEPLGESFGHDPSDSVKEGEAPKQLALSEELRVILNPRKREKDSRDGLNLRKSRSGKTTTRNQKKEGNSTTTTINIGNKPQLNYITSLERLISELETKIR